MRFGNIEDFHQKINSTAVEQMSVSFNFVYLHLIRCLHANNMNLSITTGPAFWLMLLLVPTKCCENLT